MISIIVVQNIMSSYSCTKVSTPTDKDSFLGTKTNPYGYMRGCDIFVQPSRHEGYCITLAEARCFTAPIVATNFTGAGEQLKGRPNAVVTGMDAEDMAEGIIKFL